MRDRYFSTRTLLFSVAGVAMGLGGGDVLAQAAASPTRFSSSNEGSAGGNALGTQFSVEGAGFGSGVVPSVAASANYSLAGGFPATLDASTTGVPWPTAVLPKYADLGSSSTHSLYGTELDLGAATTVQVGGTNATVTVRQRDRIDFTVPAKQVPGWYRLDVSNGGGQASVPRAIGVLPLLELGKPWGRTLPNQVVYRGHQGDNVFWIVSNLALPPVFSVPGYFGSFQLNPNVLITFLSATVTDPGGLNVVDLPAIPVGGPVHFQAVVLTSFPSYAPGGFTNVLSTY